MQEKIVTSKKQETLEDKNLKQSSIFKRLLNWIAKGAKKASEIGASCMT
ncbi:MAG: hypothetical protein HQK74_07320 [Desulfamplus sp.]|nr:hypothetical protein [Desulfamplus sp.]